MSTFKDRVNLPPSPLGYHRILSPHCGLRVSPLCLGTMGLGDKWNSFMGEMSKEKAFEVLDAFYAAGGNFIDTSSNYEEGQSEEWLGEWMELRKNRDNMVIATKFSTSYRHYKLKDDDEYVVGANFGGNHSKSIHLSLYDSLAKLKTSYIDILYLHWWDYTTSVEEVMRTLDTVVKSSKVLYIGVSAAPAWIVAKANQFARDHGLTPFVIYSGLWNVMVRDFEREILPMCIQEGIALAPWGAAGMGMFKTKAEIEERRLRKETLRAVFNSNQTDQEAKVSAALEKVGLEYGDAPLTAVALAYCLQRCPYVFPIIGARKPEVIRENIKSLEINLTKEQVKFLESLTDFDPGWPHSMYGGDPHISGESHNRMLKEYVNLRWVKHAAPIPAEKYPGSY